MESLELSVPFVSEQSSIGKSNTSSEASNFDLKEGNCCDLGSGGSSGVRFGS